MSELPILDPKPLRDLLDIGAGDDLIRELIDLVQEDVPPRVATIRAAVASADAELVMQEAHQMKGALGNLGLRRMAALAIQIESAAREGRFAAARELAEQLPEAYDAALAALLAAFPQA